jgi:protein-L-isoaspartate(D-aspartate) O-methyltransferase
MTRRPSFPARIDFSHGQPTPVRKPAVADKAAVRTGAAARAPVGPQGLGMDSVAVRASMVQKLAAQGVADKWVLQAMNGVERHRFVDPALVNQAYEDTSLPIGLGQTISKPNVVARMMELLLPRAARQAGAGAGDWHRLRLPGGRAEPPGHGGVQHRTAARPA